MKLLGRLVRVDHVHTYKLPKDLEKMDADRRYNIAKVGWDIEGLSTKSYSKDNEVSEFLKSSLTATILPVKYSELR